MNSIRRRDWLALAALPLSAYARQQSAPALQKPAPPAEKPRDPKADEDNFGPELPAGPLPPVDSGPYQGMRWQTRYLFDELDKRCLLQDFSMPDPHFGLATALIEQEDTGDLKARLLATRDGGKTWVQEKCEKNPQGVFVLDATHAWYVAGNKLLFTRDAGKKWEKFPLPEEGLTQVWFSTPEAGFLFGVGKVFYRTADSGKTWTAEPESEKLKLQSPQTYLRSIAMLPSGAGLLVGDSSAAPAEAGTLPDWMTPDQALHRRALPGTAVVFQTHDGGKTWAGQLSSAFGVLRRVRLGPSRGAVVFQYRESFHWPSELYMLDLRTGKNSSILRRKDLVLQDALLFSDGSVLVAAIQPTGRLRNSPIPGKLRVLWSPDTVHWFVMKTDYRANGNAATFASCSDGSIWVATDEGAILQLAN